MNKQRFLSGLVLLVLSCRGLAGPASDQSEGDRFTRREAEEFATTLIRVSERISKEHIHPRPVTDLCHAGLSSLYQAAGLELPARLKGEFEKADEKACFRLVASCRQALGKPERLRGQSDMLLSLRGICKRVEGAASVYQGPRCIYCERSSKGCVGVEFHDNDGNGRVRIKRVISGGPALRAGLLPGDLITHLDGRPLGDMSAEGLQYRLNSRATLGRDPVLLLPLLPDRSQGGPSTLTVWREGEKEPLAIAVEAEEFEPETVLGVKRERDDRWNYCVDQEKKIAQLRIDAITNTTMKEMVHVLTQLRRDRVRGIILDLRWCPGGLLGSSQNIVSLFVDGGTFTVIKGQKSEDKVAVLEVDAKFADLPMVVLVNAETAMAAELIAAALQDHGRAAIVGQRSKGQGSLESIEYLLDAGTCVTFPTAVFVRPNGKNLHRFSDGKVSDDWGVRPDPGCECRISPDLSRQLRLWWLRQSARPGGSNKALPLDDPEADVQRLFALKVLEERLR